MKILIFAEVYWPDVMGGGEFSTKQMAEGLVKKGHEVVVYCLGIGSREEEINGVRVNRQYMEGVSEHFMSLTKNNRFADPFTPSDKIRRKWPDLYPSRPWYERYGSIIRKEAPDAVHTASPMSYLGRVNLWKAAFDLKKPTSHVCRSPSLLELKFLGGMLDGYNRRRNAKAAAYLTALAAPSRFMLDRHHKAGIRGRSFNDVIYNAVDFPPVPLTSELIEQKENMVLYAGDLKREKGIQTLMLAVEGLEGVRLLLIGGGTLAESLRRDGRAEVLDWMSQESLYSYMRRSRAVILPSEWDEAFGRILIEAIHNGTLGIGSDRGGIPEVLDHNEDYIFDAGDAGALQRRIERVMRMPVPEYMREIDKQRKAAFEFTNNVYVERWERFFLQQLN